MSEPKRTDGGAVARAFLEHSPFAAFVGFELTQLEPDHAELRLPFKAELATTGELVHGGAISALIDTAATIAAWSAEFEAMPKSWGTAGVTVNFERPVEGADLLAKADVTRRGRNLCFCAVTVRAGGARVASGSVIYSLVQ